jgi:hypothetical protein
MTYFVSRQLPYTCQCDLYGISGCVQYRKSLSCGSIFGLTAVDSIWRLQSFKNETVLPHSKRSKRNVTFDDLTSARVDD